MTIFLTRLHKRHTLVCVKIPNAIGFWISHAINKMVQIALFCVVIVNTSGGKGRYNFSFYNFALFWYRSFANPDFLFILSHIVYYYHLHGNRYKWIYFLQYFPLIGNNCFHFIIGKIIIWLARGHWRISIITANWWNCWLSCAKRSCSFSYVN